MKLKIERIEDAGVLEKERIVFSVLANEDVGRYVVFKSKKTGETSVSNKTSATFWFPDQSVQRGDLVVLYTKGGSDKSSATQGGKSSHFFYWGKTSPLWTNSDDAIVLVNINSWAFHFPS